MASDSARGFLKRNRPPRVNISYADPYDAEKVVELPFVMGVMADLSGNASTKDKPRIADRSFTSVDTQNFDDFMASVEPGVSMSVANKLGGEDSGEKLGVTLNFSSMADLDPGQIAKQVPALNTLLEARQQLANLQRYMNGKSAAQDLLRKLLTDPKLMDLLEQKAKGGDPDAEAQG
jgi:type VI secretion system protein ImpB